MTKLRTLRWGDVLDFRGGATYPCRREVEEDCVTGGDITSSAKRDVKVLPLALEPEEGATAQALPLARAVAMTAALDTGRRGDRFCPRRSGGWT